MSSSSDLNVHGLASSLLLIATFVSLYMMFQRPTPPAPKENQKKGLGEWWLPILIFFLFTVVKFVVLSIFLLEAAVAGSVGVTGTLPPFAQKICAPVAGSSDSPQIYTMAVISLSEFIAHVLFVSGAHLRLWSQRILGRHFTFEVSVLDEHELITAGPYSWVRHPGYTGALLCGHGLVLFLQAKGTVWRECLWPHHEQLCASVYAASVGLLVFVWFFQLKRTQDEDDMLKEAFGKKWDDWAKKTRYRLIPFIL